MKKIAILFSLIFFLACGKKESKLIKQYRFVTYDSIIKQFRPGDGAFLIANKTPSSLNKEEKILTVELFEEAFLNYNNEIDQKKLKKEKLPEYKNYKWFGLPLLTKNGDKIVFIIAYYDDVHNDSFMKFANWFYIMDGGNTMLQTIINLTKKKVGPIFPNGEA